MTSKQKEKGIEVIFDRAYSTADETLSFQASYPSPSSMHGPVEGVLRGQASSLLDRKATGLQFGP